MQCAGERIAASRQLRDVAIARTLGLPAHKHGFRALHHPSLLYPTSSAQKTKHYSLPNTKFGVVQNYSQLSLHSKWDFLFVANVSLGFKAHKAMRPEDVLYWTTEWKVW